MSDWATCDLCDDLGGAARVLPTTLRHYGGVRRFTGPAATVRAYEDNSRIKELANTPGNGRVLVVDAGGSPRCALVGDTIGAEAIANGWVGIVLYGAIRDTAQLATMPLGLLALGTNPRRSARDGVGVAGVAIEIEGVTVEPGDIVFADDDGAIVVPPSAFAGRPA